MSVDATQRTNLLHVCNINCGSWMLASSGRRAFSSTWSWQFRNEWRLRLREDRELADCYARLARALPCRAARRFDRALDQLFVHVQDRLPWPPRRRLSQCPLATLFRPLARPARFLDETLAEPSQDIAKWMARRHHTPMHLTEGQLVGPLFPPWPTRLKSNIRSAFINQRLLLAGDTPLVTHKQTLYHTDST